MAAGVFPEEMPKAKKKRRTVRNHVVQAQEIARAVHRIFPTPEQRNARSVRMRHDYQNYIRECAEKGHYTSKPGSMFSDKHANLPLDLWDSTPDP